MVVTCTSGLSLNSSDSSIAEPQHKQFGFNAQSTLQTQMAPCLAEKSQQEQHVLSLTVQSVDITDHVGKKKQGEDMEHTSERHHSEIAAFLKGWVRECWLWSYN